MVKFLFIAGYLILGCFVGLYSDYRRENYLLNTDFSDDDDCDFDFDCD